MQIFKRTFLLILFSTWLAPALAQTETTQSLTETGLAVDPEAMEAFMDRVMAEALETQNISGGVVAVVEGEEVIFARGYGFADLAAKKSVDADKTLFRAASVSKLFTATAVMQLAEQGKLDLDADVNTYLIEFQIPDTYVEPITLKHLLSHTSGLEDAEIDWSLLEDASELLPLGVALERHIPKRILPPGTLAAYSNYGVALAGFIVEEVSGMSFDDYVDNYIFNPLGMRHSTFREPVPVDFLPDLSKGFVYENGKFVEQGFEYLHNVAPAGSLSATATDMARFISAHLQDGALASERIMEPETAQQMHSQLFSHHPQLPGIAYGFYEQYINGQRLLIHGGDTPLFHTSLVLLPEENVGFYVAFNSPGGAVAADQLTQPFMDEFFPGSHSKILDSLLSHTDKTADYVGYYRLTHASTTTIDKFLAMVFDYRVQAVSDGRLHVSSLTRPNGTFEQIESDLFREVDGQFLVAFRRDEMGRVTHFFDRWPVLSYRKVSWYESRLTTLIALGTSLLIFLGVIIGTLFALPTIVRHSDDFLSPRLAISVAALFNVFFLIGFVLALADMRNTFGGRLPTTMQFSLWMPVLGATFAIVALWKLPAVWRNSKWTAFRRVRYTGSVTFLFLFLAFLFYWNLVPWGL